MSETAAEYLAELAVRRGAEGARDERNYWEHIAEKCARLEQQYPAGRVPLRVVSAVPTRSGVEAQVPRDAESDAEDVPEIGATGCHAKERQLVTLVQSRRGAPGISAEQLAVEVQISERTVRALIQHLRAVHALPIAGSPQESFFWPRNAEDLTHTKSSLGSRIMEMQRTLRGIERGEEREFGQPVLPFGEGR